MTTKRKLWTSLACLALVFVIAGATIGITFAALSGTVNSGFKISYTANSISAGIFGSYGYSSDKMKAMTSNNDNKILFNKDENFDKSFDDIQDIELSADNDSVTFKYRFLNFGRNDMPLSLTLNGDMENLKIDYTITTFDGEEKDEKTGSSANVPLSLTSFVPYSNYNSYDNILEDDQLKLELAELLGSQDMMTSITSLMVANGLTLENGYEKVSDAIDALSDGDSQEGDSIEVVILKAFYIFPYFAVYKYNQTKSLSETIEYLENILNYELEKAGVDDEVPLDMIFMLSWAFGPSPHIWLYQAYFTDNDPIENYESLFEDIIKYFIYRRFCWDPPEFIFWGNYYNDAVLMQKLIHLNIYNTFLNEGLESAISLIDRLYENDIYIFCPIHPEVTSSEIYENYQSFKEELQILDEKSNKVELVNSIMNNLKSEIKLYKESYDDSYTEATEEINFLISIIEDPIYYAATSTDLIPYTELIVTISIADKAADAYIKNGRFDFVLG